MQILPQEPKPRPNCRALIHRGNQWYDGWTGYEFFGCLVPHRYFGWRLHCWAHVYVAAFGDIRQGIFFARVHDSLAVIDRLMDFADARGDLSHEPVKYWPDGDIAGRFVGDPSLFRQQFEFISEILVSDPRAPETPARERRRRRRFGKGGPLTKEAKQFLEWRLSAPLPQLYL